MSAWRVGDSRVEGQRGSRTEWAPSPSLKAILDRERVIVALPTATRARVLARVLAYLSSDRPSETAPVEQ
jgi:hypothetical protein